MRSLVLLNPAPEVKSADIIYSGHNLKATFYFVASSIHVKKREKGNDQREIVVRSNYY